MSPVKTQATRKRGFASLLVLMLVGVFAALSTAHFYSATISLRQSQSQADVQAATMEAESGLEFYRCIIEDLGLSNGLEGQDLMDEVYQKLSERAEITGNLNGQQLTYDGTSIRIPAVNIDGKNSFATRIKLVGPDMLLVRTEGRAGDVSRSIAVNAVLQDSAAMCPAHGIVSRGRISVTGNARVSGANTASEGSIYTATQDANALTMIGNTDVDGEFYATNPDGYATLIGNVSVGGGRGNAAHDHVHFGVPPFEIPDVDPTVFEPYATETVDHTTRTNGNLTFHNIRIRANTNPTFSGNITIRGVVYVEKPNQVTFTGNLDMTGTIVADSGHENPGNGNQINFRGNTSSRGVEDLPDTPEFAGLRDLEGAFMLTPGFEAEFTGNFGVVNGVMAANSFDFTGNAGGTIKGSLIQYGDNVLDLTGNSGLTFDHQTYTDPIPGLVASSRLVFMPGTYSEW